MPRRPEPGDFHSSTPITKAGRRLVSDMEQLALPPIGEFATWRRALVINVKSSIRLVEIEVQNAKE